MSKAETIYQAGLISRIEAMFPNCFVQKLQRDERQGVPDLLVLIGSHWAMLEVKVSANSEIQPNQEYYVDRFNHMSFAAFIYPENEEEVLDALQHTFRDSW